MYSVQYMHTHKLYTSLGDKSIAIDAIISSISPLWLLDCVPIHTVHVVL